MEITNQHVDAVIGNYIDTFIAKNRFASIVNGLLQDLGVGLRPLIDHLSVRTLDVQERALEFEALGYLYDDRLGVIEHDTWWAKVYRKPGFPAVYLDQAFADHRGAESPIGRWVDTFSDAQLHHIAITVGDIDHAVARLREAGLTFTGEITGTPGGVFRQIYTEPEMVGGEPYTLLELVERRWGYAGFVASAESE